MFGAGKFGGFGLAGQGVGGWSGPEMSREWSGGGWDGGPGSGVRWAGGSDRPGFGGPFKKAAVVGGLLLDGPADADEVVKRLSKASHGVVKPPKERVELLLAMMAGKGVVTLDDGDATLTELGRNLLAWRGINADTARALLAQAAKFGDVFKIRRELRATAELARRITWTGTDEQKKTLKAAKASILEAITDAQRSLYRALAADSHAHESHDHEVRPQATLTDDELQALRSLLAKLAQ